ncbi:MAG: DUF3050 domain-containing protein [Bacteroidota bacterium]
MNKQIQHIEQQLTDLKTSLRNHRIYAALTDLEDVKIFMSAHVYAVWDFMSLLKALQQQLTCTAVPWQPVQNAKTARFINEIVHGEETDLNVDGIPKSHFEMYLDAMEEVGVDTAPMLKNIQQFSSLRTIERKLDQTALAPALRAFLGFTFDTIQSKQAHKIAAAFTFGREDLIPDMFINIIEKSKTDFAHFKYYLERHIELDGDEHGPLSLEMIQELCGNNEQKWDDVLATAKAALHHRIQLWDEIADQVKAQKPVMQAVELV